MFTRMLQQARRTPEQFTELAAELFRVMAAGGRVGFEAVAWFNGGLFDDGAALPLEAADIETVLAASDLDWSEIDPSILGTLFERGLDPGKRAQLGAHYTDRDKIMLLVEPVKPLDTIECRDAILAPDSAEPDWPKADVVIVADPKGVIVAGETRYKAAVGDRSAQCTIVSIRAPARGATRERRDVHSSNCCFNPRPRTGGDTQR